MVQRFNILILIVTFLVIYVKSDEHICSLPCISYSDGCQKCTNATLQCTGKGLTSVCASYFNENSTVMHDVDLRNNKISSFSTFPNSTIKILNLADNNITSLAKADLERFPLLEHLWIEDNPVKFLPKDVFEGIVHIEFLHMAGMQLTDLPDDIFKQTKALMLLDLSRNKLVSVPAKSFQPGNRITTLLLNENPIASFGLADFIQLKKLEKLDVHGLMITTILGHVFSSLPNLKEINLDFNSELRFIDEDAFGWQNKVPEKMASSLSTVSIRSCGLSNLDRHAFNYMGLDSFKFTGNPWECDCSMEWLINKTNWEGAKAKEVMLLELNSSRCDNARWKGIPLSAVPVAELDGSCNKKEHPFKMGHPLSHLSSSLSTVTTIMIITLLVCCISVVLGILMFRRCTRQATLPPAVNQYRAIYNQGHVQSMEEGMDKDAKSPYEL